MSNLLTIDLSITTINDKLPEFIGAGLASYAENSNSYHRQTDELRQKIASKFQVTADHVYLTAGADQAILLLSVLYGQHAHVFTPTYISYTDVRRVGGELTEHPVLDGSVYNVPTSKIEGASLIFLANPNNPAGITSREKVLELVRNNPDAKVVVDEAYGDFADESVINDVVNHKNLVVLRSFSKGYSLAGFRIGYIIAAPEILEQLFLESTWFNVAYTSIGAAVIALENEGYFNTLRQSIIIERQKNVDFLEKLGYQTIPSHINAILIKFSDEDSGTKFAEKLKKANIKVNLGNGGSNCGLNSSFMRVSIGTASQMQAFRNAVAS